MIKPGETSVAVLKKNKNVEKSVWPPKGVEIYR